MKITTDLLQPRQLDMRGCLPSNLQEFRSGAVTSFPWFYSAYGLRIAANGELPGFRSASPLEPADLEISLVSHLPRPCGLATVLYTSPRAGANTIPNLTVWNDANGSVCFDYASGAQFRISRDGAALWLRSASAAEFQDSLVYLMGAVLGFVVRLRGGLSLHASSVSATPESAFACVGGCGAGKSTTATALVLHGLRLLADDVTAITWSEGEAFIEPGHRRLNLWPQSAPVFSKVSPELPRLNALDGTDPSWDKRFLEIQGDCLADRVRLKAIYLIGARGTGDAFEVRPLDKRTALVELVSHSTVNYLLTSEMRQREFEQLSSLVARVPVRLVRFPRKIEHLDVAVKSLIGDFSALAECG